MAGYRRPGKTPEIPASLHLPPVLYGMFKPKDPIEYIEKVETANYGRKVDGISSFVHLFEKESVKTAEITVERENKYKKREREDQLRAVEFKKQLERAKRGFNPKDDAKKHPEKYTNNAVNTLFVARLSYETTEETLRQVFSSYGAVKAVKLVKTGEGKSRGYAFVEFEEQSAMQEAYKKANKQEIDGRKILTDVERGRTVSRWLPRRLGGGLGGASRRKKEVRKRQRSADQPNKRNMRFKR